MRQRRLNTLWKFLILVAIIYASLVGIGPFLKLNKLNASFYGSVSKKLFSEMGEKGIVVFEEVKGNVGINDQDYQLTLINKESLEEVKREAAQRGSADTKAKVKAKNVFLNFWQFGFVPTALLLALIIATPLPWKRKVLGFIIAWIMLQAFIFVRIYLTILNHFQQTEWLAIYDFSERQNHVLYFASERLLYFGSSLILVVFLWVISISGAQEFKKLRKELFAA